MEDLKLKLKHIFLFILVGLLLIGVILGISWSRKVVSKANQLISLANGIRDFDVSNFGKSDISRLVDLSNQIALTLGSLREDIDPIVPISRNLTFLPVIGKYIPLVEPGLDFAESLSEAAVILGSTVEPMIDKIENGSSNNATQLVSEFVKENRLNFVLVEEKFAGAVDAGSKINPELLPMQYREDFTKIIRLIKNYPAAFNAIEAAPYLLGDEAPITYLIAVQNKDELRATGGFITAFGLARLRDGQIIGLRVDDSTDYHQFNYVTEIREPPFPLKEIMFAHYFVARDANWSPDFPQAAELVQEMYHLSTEEKVDGMVAFDQEFIVRLLDFTGPLYLPDDDSELISADNVEEKMISYKLAAEEEGNALERKEFLSVMGPLIMDEVSDIADLSELIELLRLFYKSFKEGHLLVQINKPEIQAVLTKFALDGAVRPGAGDYLMLVDSNVGIGKIDQFIERSLEYSVNLVDVNQPTGQIKMRYMHTEPGIEPCLQGSSILAKDLITDAYNFSRCYWNYWRVLRPSGITLAGSDYAIVPEEYFLYEKKWDDTPLIQEGERGTMVISGLTVVEQKSEETILLENGLPTKILEETSEGNLVYRLRVQKQPGIIELPLSIELKAPTGYILETSQDDWQEMSGGEVYYWEDSIRETADFELVFIIEQSDQQK